MKFKILFMVLMTLSLSGEKLTTTTQIKEIPTASKTLVKDKIYFAKEINPRKNSGNSFLIFWGDNNFYELSTKEYQHLTVEQFMKHIKGEKKLVLKKMTTMRLRGKYYRKNNAFYIRTIFGDVKIKMSDRKHISCNGREYSLVE